MRSAHLMLLIALTVCSPEPPSEPTPTGPPTLDAPSIDVTGTWSGRYEETSCHSNSCTPCCSMRFKGGPWRRDFTLTLRQQNANVAGRFEELPLNGVSALSGVVSGTVSGHRFQLVGKLGAHVASDAPFFTELQDLDARVDASGKTATGTFALADKQPDGSDFMRRECKIDSLDRE